MMTFYPLNKPVKQGWNTYTRLGLSFSANGALNVSLSNNKNHIIITEPIELHDKPMTHFSINTKNKKNLKLLANLEHQGVITATGGLSITQDKKTYPIFMINKDYLKINTHTKELITV